MKCTNCKSKKLREIMYPFKMPDFQISLIRTFVCEDCGHIEFYATDIDGKKCTASTFTGNI